MCGSHLTLLVLVIKMTYNLSSSDFENRDSVRYVNYYILQRFVACKALSLVDHSFGYSDKKT